jgi:integrase
MNIRSITHLLGSTVCGPNLCPGPGHTRRDRSEMTRYLQDRASVLLGDDTAQHAPEVRAEIVQTLRIPRHYAPSARRDRPQRRVARRALFPGNGKDFEMKRNEVFPSKYLKAADLNGARLHDLRHTYASTSASAGLTIRCAHR